VLRQIVEHPAFKRKVVNEAFVTVEYFGYLRRDQTLKLCVLASETESVQADFSEAEMVKAFLSSDEYPSRF
jgi:hypothetical protein